MIKAITLRNIPPDLAKAIEQEAARTGASLNATVIKLLERTLMPQSRGARGEPARYHDLDFLAGSWTKQEADAFDRYLEESRRIDMELTRLEWEREEARE